MIELCKFDPVRAGRIVPITSFAGSRDPGASPPTQYPPAEVTEAADPWRDRSLGIRWALWLAPEVLSALAIVGPETVIRWHRVGFRCIGDGNRGRASAVRRRPWTLGS